jgi:hypothetical protein
MANQDGCGSMEDPPDSGIARRTTDPPPSHRPPPLVHSSGKGCGVCQSQIVMDGDDCFEGDGIVCAKCCTSVVHPSCLGISGNMNISFGKLHWICNVCSKNPFADYERINVIEEKLNGLLNIQKDLSDVKSAISKLSRPSIDNSYARAVSADNFAQPCQNDLQSESTLTRPSIMQVDNPLSRQILALSSSFRPRTGSTSSQSSQAAKRTRVDDNPRPRTNPGSQGRNADSGAFSGVPRPPRPPPRCHLFVTRLPSSCTIDEFKVLHR